MTYIVMNRFKIKEGSEEIFADIWRNRDSHLNEMSGFIRFNLFRGKTESGYTLFSSFTEWQSKSDFEAWVKSDQFKASHRSTGDKSQSEIYIAAPELECFETIL